MDAPQYLKNNKNLVLKVTALYILAASIWILVSDRILAWFVPDADMYMQFQTYKGWLFVLFTGLLLYIYLHPRINELNISRKKYRDAEKSLKSRLEYELATIRCMRLLLEPGELDETMPRILDVIHGTVKNSRSYIFRNEEDPELGTCMTQIYEIASDGIEPQIDNPELQHLPYSKGAPSMLPVLLGKQHFAHVVEELDYPERTILEKQGILSVLILPIFSGKDFWGFIGFDDCVEVRRWNDDDINLLKVVADGIGEAVFRKKAENELKDSKERFKALHDASFGGIAIHDKGIILDCNQGLAEISGYSPEELKGMDGRLLITESCLSTVIERVRSGYKDAYEVTGRRKDGTEYYARIQGRNIPYKGKQVRVVELRDISEQKRSEQALRKNEEMQSAMIANITDVIAIVDKEGYVKYKSPNIKELFGWEPEETIGKPILENIHPDDKKAAEDFLNDIIGLKRSTATSQARYQCKDDTYKWIKFTATNLLDEPAIGGILFNYHDITERKEAQDALIQAKAMAEENSRIKSQFLANMSHELRTPLTAIIGFSDILSDRDLCSIDEKQLGYVRHIHRNGIHLLELINDVLDLSKIESGKMELHREKIPLYEAVREVHASMSPMADKKNIHLEIVNETHKDEIYADRLKFRQIMFNLLSNAIKFTPDNGSVRIYIKGTGNEIQLSVSDTGIGIPWNMQDRIFSPFTQVDSSNKRRYDGTGLGLALVKQFVEMHNGRVWVESEEGKGSTFTFTIGDQDSKTDGM